MDAARDFRQNWDAYGAAEHAIWRTLFHRQEELLKGRACREFLDGIARLGVAADGIPVQPFAQPAAF